MAHEIGHITEQHAVKLYTEIKANQCTVAMGSNVAGEVLKSQSTFDLALGTPGGFLDLNAADAVGPLTQLTDGFVEQLTSLGYAESDEFDADRIALELVLAAGYQPREYIKLLGKLPEGGGAFAHHPKNGERQRRLESWLHSLRPTPNTFAYADWPFDRYPTVALKNELWPVK